MEIIAFLIFIYCFDKVWKEFWGGIEKWVNQSWPK